MRITSEAEIGKRLRSWGKAKFGSIGAFARALGVSSQALAGYFKGRRTPGSRLQTRLRSIGMDVEWLMTGRLQVLGPNNLTEQYPVVGRIKAGHGGLAEPRYEYDVKRTEVGPADPRYRGSLFFEVKGDSMEPRWEEGDLVLASPHIKPKNGDYGIICWDREEGSLKKIYFKNGKVHLQSINPRYETVVIDSVDVWFLGKVLLTKHRE